MSPTSQEKLADQFDKYARYTVLAVIPIALIAVVDLATGSMTGDRRIDIASLAAATMGLWSAFSLRRLAQQFRGGNLLQRATPALWARTVLSIAVSPGFTAGVGYLIGGWVPAVALSSATAVLTGSSVVLGL